MLYDRRKQKVTKKKCRIFSIHSSPEKSGCKEWLEEEAEWYDSKMSEAKGTKMFEVTCPCCQAVLKIDPQTRSVITSKAHEKPRPLEDIETGLERLKEDTIRREEVFRKSFEAEKMQQQVLAKKFDELFKKAKETANEPPPKRDIDLD